MKIVSVRALMTERVLHQDQAAYVVCRELDVANGGALHGNLVTAVLNQDIDWASGKDWTHDNKTKRTLLRHTRVRVVMTSRFGDVGITDDHNIVHYCARVEPNLLIDWDISELLNKEWKEIVGPMPWHTATIRLEP
jgi:hypothetical protein